MTRKQTIGAAVGLVGFLLSVTLFTIVRLNVETWATENGYDKIWVQPLAFPWVRAMFDLAPMLTAVTLLTVGGGAGLLIEPLIKWLSRRFTKNKIAPPLSHQQSISSTANSAPVAPTMGAPSGGLLSEPFASMPPSETQTLPPHLWWKALADLDEGPERREARKRIVIASKRFLWPAMHALVPFYASARDAVSNHYPQGRAKNAIVRGLDLAHGDMSQATKVTVHELQNPDVVAKLSLHDAVSNYYYNFGNYVRGVQLSFDLIKAAKPQQELLDRIRVEHDKWRKAHDAMQAEHVRLASEDPRLDMLRTMHDDVGLQIPNLEWNVPPATQ